MTILNKKEALKLRHLKNELSSTVLLYLGFCVRKPLLVFLLSLPDPFSFFLPYYYFIRF